LKEHRSSTRTQFLDQLAHQELLARVHLLDAEHRPLRHFSKGMAQRAGLARRSSGEPELVFPTQPTSGLDLSAVPGARADRGTACAGATVFLNSHLLGEVEATCDRVAFVKQGRTVHELPLKELDGIIRR